MFTAKRIAATTFGPERRVELRPRRLERVGPHLGPVELAAGPGQGLVALGTNGVHDRTHLVEEPGQVRFRAQQQRCASMRVEGRQVMEATCLRQAAQTCGA